MASLIKFIKARPQLLPVLIAYLSLFAGLASAFSAFLVIYLFGHSQESGRIIVLLSFPAFISSGIIMALHTELFNNYIKQLLGFSILIIILSYMVGGAFIPSFIIIGFVAAAVFILIVIMLGIKNSIQVIRHSYDV